MNVLSLQSGCGRCTKLLSIGWLRTCLIALQVYLLTVWRGRSTPGSQLLNLRYRDERAMGSPGMQLDGRSGIEGLVPSTSQRCFYGVGYVVFPYLWSRANRAAVQLEWEERVALMSGPPMAMPPLQQQQQGLSWLLQITSWSRMDVARLARGAMRRAEAAYRVAVLLNLVAFLRTGTFRWRPFLYTA
eukprot:352421-Chlamydomonas_euryale.AAC.86